MYETAISIFIFFGGCVIASIISDNLKMRVINKKLKKIQEQEIKIASESLKRIED